MTAVHGGGHSSSLLTQEVTRASLFFLWEADPRWQPGSCIDKWEKAESSSENWFPAAITWSQHWQVHDCLIDERRLKKQGQVRKEKGGSSSWNVFIQKDCGAFLIVRFNSVAVLSSGTSCFLKLTSFYRFVGCYTRSTKCFRWVAMFQK